MLFIFLKYLIKSEEGLFIQFSFLQRTSTILSYFLFMYCNFLWFIFQAFEDEFKRRQTTFSAIAKKGEELCQEGAHDITEPELHLLSRRWNEVNNQVVSHRSPVRDVSVADKASPVWTARSPSLSPSRQVSMSTERFSLDLQKLLKEISHVQNTLRSPELHGNEFTDLSQQDILLKVCIFHTYEK